MREIELKFRIPPERLAALRKSLATPTAEREILQATYFDTEDRALAERRVALRIRREGRRWVQTAKAVGADPMSRLEHEVDLGTRRPDLAGGPDPALHLPHPELHHALLEAIAAAGSPLGAIYGTRVERLRRVIRNAGARVEVALDEGRIEAGSAVLPVSEIEFELLDGPVDGLLELARRWVRRHHLWLDVRSKAERGDHLARGAPRVPAARMAPVVLNPDLHPAQALALGLQAALAAWLANASELADASGDARATGPADDRADGLHQLRVSLRRVRVLLSVFGDWLPEPKPPADGGAPSPAIEPPLDQQLGALFRLLGQRRDEDVLVGLIGGPLEQAGYARPRFVPSDDPVDPSASVRSLAFTDAALRLLQRIARAESQVVEAVAQDHVRPEAESAAAEAPPLRRLAAQALQREWKRFARDARHFAALEPRQQHKVRKRAKRLRYALDFCQSLFPKRRVARFLKSLAEVQDALGTYTDVLMGQDHLARRPLDDAAAAFARGWLSARREVTLKACERPLRRLLKARTPWA